VPELHQRRMRAAHRICSRRPNSSPGQKPAFLAICLDTERPQRSHSPACAAYRRIMSRLHRWR